MPNTLLIHDTRTVGVITAAVLARVLSRINANGGKVHALFGRDITLSVRKFWQNARRLITKQLRQNPCETIILCCIGFDDLNEDACKETLEWLQSKAELVIYSHKWPDGYARAGFEVCVAPHAIVEKYVGHIEPVEWELLRASLIVARETDREFANDADLVFADQLAKTIWPSSSGSEEQHWARLTNNLSDVVTEIKKGNGGGQRAQVKRTERNDRFIVYELEEERPVSIEKTLEANSADPDFPNPGIAIGFVNWDRDEPQAHLLRPWQQRKNLPSIAHLIKTYGEKYELRDWIGSQDAMHVRVPREERGPKALIQNLPGKLREFCNSVASLPFGSRQPQASVAQFIHKQATEVLEKLDLFKNFIGRFDPEGTQIILSQSNRSHEPITQTLALKLVVETPEAAAFLFGHGGYNFTKLETSLDGALGAIAKIPSLWLGAMTIPSKLRIDADLRLPLESIGDAFRKLKEVAPLVIREAVTSGLVKNGSVIARALEQDEPLIVFRGSETIGPSVQYQILSHAIVNALHQQTGEKVNVLELFSGSGYCSRKLTKPEGMARTVCVDASVDASTALLQDTADVIWLRTPIDEVLRAEGVYYRTSYDIILMDPPHGMILDLLFGGSYEGSVAERASKLSHGLVIYVGHDSQATRSHAVALALREWYQRVTEWRVGSERLISAGQSRLADGDAWEYDAVIEVAGDLAMKRAKHFDQQWPVEIVANYGASI